MEFLVIAIIVLVVIISQKFLFRYDVKKIKGIAENRKELDELAKKYPSNVELCKTYLKMLKNETVKVEENKESDASLYIAISNKITIANVRDSFTRIQTIAHECLHSVQDRKMLLFNFIYSNIYILYFIVICILALFKILPYKLMFLTILIILGMVYYAVRAYLENDAMTKAKYLAKEYMDDAKITTKEETDRIVEGFDELNNIAIKATNYSLLLSVMVQTFIFSIICFIR